MIEQAMSPFWSMWISVITLAVVVGVTWLLIATRKSEKFKESTEETLGHSFDGIEEYDNPLPRWWFMLFIGTVIFSLGYLALYPGLGNFKGLLGWTSTSQWEDEIKHAEEHYAPVFNKYASLSYEELMLPENSNGIQMGKRLFANNCSVCHGVGGVGAKGFPNLTDNDWLYGGNTDAIYSSIVNGRQGAMPAWGDILGEDKVLEVTHYVRGLSSLEGVNEQLAKAGEVSYMGFCAGCHMPDGSGMQALGAPNLKDSVWLYGSSIEDVAHSVRAGRGGVMPSHKELLSEEKIKLITAYVKSLTK